MRPGRRLQPEFSAVSIRPARRALQRKCDCGQHAAAGECDSCARGKLSLQRRSASRAEGAGVPPVVHDTLRSRGQPLDTATRSRMESHFHHDFSRVRVHTDARAAESARSVNALAYTVGQDIVFGQQQHAPGTAAGARLMAHELAHVVQQEGAPAVPASDLEMGRPADHAEAEADEAASSAQGNAQRQAAGRTGLRLARQSAGGPAQSQPAARTLQDLMDEGNVNRMWYLRRAIERTRLVEIACEKKAEPLLMIEALPQEVRPFVSWLGTMPTDASFCTTVSWARALMEENMNMTVPPFIFAERTDPFCMLGGEFPYARFEDSGIRVCPKLFEPANTNSVLRGLVIIHEMFHDPRFRMDHPTMEVMNSSHCGTLGTFEAITNPYCMTNLIGHLGGGYRAVM